MADHYTTEEIVAQLPSATRTGEGQWLAKCPAHADGERSLSVKAGRSGTLLHCFAGCSAEAVCRALGVSMTGLFYPTGGAPVSSGPRWGCTLREYAAAKRLAEADLARWGVTEDVRTSKNNNTYPTVRIPYRNEQGDETAVRFRSRLNKDTDGEGKRRDMRFFWGEGSKLGLYGLWRMSDWERERGAGQVGVYLVEGESDCHTMWTHGLPCLGLPGASSYREDRDAPALERYEVIWLVTEPDRGGATLVGTFAGDPDRQRPPSRLAQKIRVVVLEGAKDVSGLYLDAPGEFEKSLVKARKKSVPLMEFRVPPEWTDRRAETSSSNGATGGRPKTDYYLLATTFLEAYRINQTYTLRSYRGAWYEWTGVYYEPLADDDLAARVMAFLQGEDARMIGGAPNRNCVTNVMANLQSTRLCNLDSRLAAPFWISSGQPADGWMPMANQAVYLAGLADDLDSEDHSPWIIPNTPDLFSTYGQQYSYDPAATCPTFETYLRRVQPEEAGREVIRQMMGLCLVPGTEFNVAFFLYGIPGTGKSVFLHILQHVVGLDNCCSVPLARFGEKHSTWPLTEKLLNVIGDLETDDGRGGLAHLEGTFKDVTDGGWIPVERKHKDVSRGRVTARCIFATNQLPAFRDKTEAMWDRLRILPFNIRIRNTAEDNPYLRQEITDSELPGILNWALRGLGILRRGRRFPEHPQGMTEKLHHRSKCDLERCYLEEHYVYSEQDIWTNAAQAYAEYKAWLIEGGFAVRTRNTFDEAVHRVFGERPSRAQLIDGNRMWIYRHIGKRFT